MPLSPDEFRQGLKISVLRASLYLLWAGAAACRTSNSAELTEAGMNPPAAQSPALLPTAHQQPPHLRALSHFTLSSECAQSPDLCRMQFHGDNYHLLSQKSRVIFLFQATEVPLILHYSLNSLLFVSQLAVLGLWPQSQFLPWWRVTALPLKEFQGCCWADQQGATLPNTPWPLPDCSPSFPETCSLGKGRGRADHNSQKRFLSNRWTLSTQSECWSWKGHQRTSRPSSCPQAHPAVPTLLADICLTGSYWIPVPGSIIPAAGPV